MMLAVFCGDSVMKCNLLSQCSRFPSIGINLRYCKPVIAYISRNDSETSEAGLLLPAIKGTIKYNIILMTGVAAPVVMDFWWGLGETLLFDHKFNPCVQYSADKIYVYK